MLLEVIEEVFGSFIDCRLRIQSILIDSRSGHHLRVKELQLCALISPVQATRSCEVEKIVSTRSCPLGKANTGIVVSIRSSISRLIDANIAIGISGEEDVGCVVIKGLIGSQDRVNTGEFLKIIALDTSCLVSRFMLPAAHDSCSCIRLITILSEIVPVLLRLCSSCHGDSSSGSVVRGIGIGRIIGGSTSQTRFCLFQTNTRLIGEELSSHIGSNLTECIAKDTTNQTIASCYRPTSSHLVFHITQTILTSTSHGVIDNHVACTIEASRRDDMACGCIGSRSIARGLTSHDNRLTCSQALSDIILTTNLTSGKAHSQSALFKEAIIGATLRNKAITNGIPPNRSRSCSKAQAICSIRKCSRATTSSGHGRISTIGEFA